MALSPSLLTDLHAKGRGSGWTRTSRRRSPPP